MEYGQRVRHFVFFRVLYGLPLIQFMRRTTGGIGWRKETDGNAVRNDTPGTVVDNALPFFGLFHSLYLYVWHVSPACSLGILNLIYASRDARTFRFCTNVRCLILVIDHQSCTLIQLQFLVQMLLLLLSFFFKPRHFFYWKTSNFVSKIKR